jgi:hypothetical protein
MDYVGIDHWLGLSCSACQHTTAMRYSDLLNHLVEGESVVCDGCGRETNHDWTSIEEARNLVAEHMRRGKSFGVA